MVQRVWGLGYDYRVIAVKERLVDVIYRAKVQIAVRLRKNGVADAEQRQIAGVTDGNCRSGS